MIVPTNVGTAKTSSREGSGPGAREAGRDWRFFWSSRTGAMHLYMGQFKAGGINSMLDGVAVGLVFRAFGRTTACTSALRLLVID